MVCQSAGCFAGRQPASAQAAREARALGAMSGPVSAPQHLTSEHNVSAFDCAVPELNDWLKRRALQLTAAVCVREI